jgi:hypothetical protein
METIENVLTLCAWCPMNGRPEKLLKQGVLINGRASHGICADCSAIEKAKREERIQMKTLNEMKQHVGKQGLIRQSNILFAVTVLDVRQVYGRLQYLVKPVSGEGMSWINDDSLLKGQVQGNESNKF